MPTIRLLLFVLPGLLFQAPALLAQALPQQPLPGTPATTPPANPNQDRFPQPQPAPLAPLPPEPATPLPLPTPAPAPAAGNQTVAVGRVEVTGSTILSAEQIAVITRPVEGQTLTREQILSSVVIPLTSLYIDRGYLTSRAELASVEDGAVRVRILEGTISRIEVEGTQRLNTSYVRDRVALAVSKPLNTSRLEDQLRLLRTDPLLANVEATLRRGEASDQSVLIVRVSEAPALATSLSFDNYSPPAVGSERGIASLAYRNLTGIGDTLAFGYSVSTGAANIYDVNYRVPLNPMDGTLALRFAATNTKITEPPFNTVGIAGTSELAEISYRQPLFRSFSEEFALSLGFTYQSGQTVIFSNLPTPFGIGPDANGVSRTSVFKFGQDYLSRDEVGAWLVRSQFSFGTGIFGATINGDSIPDSRFVSWLGQFSRLQLLGSGNALIFQGDLQLSFDPLLAAQQYILGGVQSVRGYRQNARQGDNGFRLSVEGRFPVVRNDAGQPVFQLAPFVEGGGVWNAGGNPNLLPDKRFLITAGLGFLWQALPGLNLRVDYGIPFVFLPDRGSNLQDNGFYFSLSYQPQ
ncbi:ShlB/FhaC/HecB family hemolysin secretion/activation protein [Gloeobacter kilaueensis]|uniref:Bifunctional uroporphyrinogen-III synthetase/uroporphyrin-III C-methyltransferase n=1 Tax=Gloeobacter kilaueensis (strain ATCC BAA-2537 / CCAP 1431/1 / ULC 316 / JS1) TaxID=1183438 RepID=U5QQQ3_GLOK1|nr:ShlB/FhaC/HecB family hemolysin secretion/activation protein [Gloeobacter kilaueensis]AGY59949.1 bifunctional uroporphyrinogen-III synthetase/uroporphyrin-III C-methyltransferase [Gloeobacter kilaueensis JS1]